MIHTFWLILGWQFIQNRYVLMTSEQWMRKTTAKKFKRYDVLMRHSEKVCIIDWKFSKIEAETKISEADNKACNKLYYELARKDFRT